MGDSTVEVDVTEAKWLRDESVCTSLYLPRVWLEMLQ